MEKEKVIRGLECCIKSERDCLCPENCPYADADETHDLCETQVKLAALALLKEQPEIVRCKDCIDGDDFDCPAPLPTGYLCQKGHGSHTGDWFCADGGKR